MLARLLLFEVNQGFLTLFFILLDGEQVVSGLVPEQNSYAFKAEVLRQDFSTIHDEV